MATALTFDMPFLHFDASSVADHDVILSGPAPTAPSSDFENGTATWRGPYGPTIATWTDASHPPGDPSIHYSAPTTPNPSWIFDTQIPAGWYTIVGRREQGR